MLNAGGLLFMDQTDFAFEKTALATRYRVADFEGNRAAPDRPLFGKDNLLMSGGNFCARCFVKRAA